MAKNISRILILSIFSLFFLISLVSAINVIPTQLTIDKTFGADYDMSIQVHNTHTFAMYNMTFDNNFISLPKFNLAVGEIKNVTLTFNKNEEFNGEIRLRGDYFQSIGSSNNTEIVNVDYGSGFDVCNLNLIKGDSIKWNNLHSDTIKLVNKNTGQTFATISPGQNYIQAFSSPVNFDYYATWIGIQFTSICNINIQNDVGYVHNSNYDGIISLDLNIIYDPTTIQTSFTQTNYTINYDGKKSGLFTIENTGNKIAKKVHFEADWFTFTENDFDLNAGDSINVGYTISPQIFNTNSTGKNYTKTLKTSGNFNTTFQDFLISIPYEEVDVFGSAEINNEVIQNFFKYWCKDNLEQCESLYCAVNPIECKEGKIVGGDVIQRFSEDTIKGLIEGYGTLIQQVQDGQKATNENIAGLSLNSNTNANETASLKEEINSMKESNTNISIALIFVIVFMLTISMGGILLFFWKNQGARDFVKKRLKFHKGEKR